MNKVVAIALVGQAFVKELIDTWENDDAVLPIDTRLPPVAQRKLAESFEATDWVDETGKTNLPNGRPAESGDALIVATSGTTSEPKGVVHTHESVHASAICTSEALAATTNDKWLCCLPVAHVGGLSVITRSLLTNIPFTILPTFDADTVENEARDGATLVSLVPTALKRIDPALFRLIVVGGAAPPDPRPKNVVASYGMTETGSGIVYERRPLRDVELKINDGGEVEVRSQTLFRCYRDGSDPKRNGWFATGDAGEIVNDELHIHGRLAEVINSGGEKIWPASVEAVLRTHSDISDARVFGESDNEWGERVVAEIVLKSNREPSLAEIREYVKETLPSFAAPKQVRFVKHVDRTTSGKIRRTRMN